MVAAADRAMYEAKRLGGNQVHFAQARKAPASRAGRGEKKVKRAGKSRLSGPAGRAARRGC
ncbi:MAG: hypothetical protein AMXMBFR34_34270 [Myxococcaceae bacterium]